MMMTIILEAALRALALALVVALALGLLRVKNVPAQRAAWTVVILSAIAMPLLMRCTWLPSQLTWMPTLPLLREDAPITPQNQVTSTVRFSNPSSNLRIVQSPRQTSAAPTPQKIPSNGATFSARFMPAIPFIYCAVCFALMLRLFTGLITATRLWSKAKLVSELSTSGVQVRVSQAVHSPVTIGSGIVLPNSFTEWDAEKLRIVLAHERAHVRQFDFYLQLFAGLYTAVFWFSPLGWYLRRKLSDLAEAISDRAGLTEAPTRSAYAEIVLQFAALPRRTTIGVAMARPGNISRRIDQLLNEDLYHTAFTASRRRAWLLFLFLPCIVFATSMLVRVPSARAEEKTTSRTESPFGDFADRKPDAPLALVAQNSAPAPIAPEAPQSATDDNSVTVQHSTTNHKHHSNAYAYGFSDGDSYAIVDGADSSMTISGNWNSDDMKAAIDKARRQTNGKFLWFHHDGKAYIVTDPAVLSEIQALYKPMEDLGRQQEELGKKQEELGKEQERLGSLQEKATTPAPDLTREIAELNEALAKLQAAKGKELSQEELANLQGRVGDLQGKLGEMQGKIGEKQGSFGEAQGRLGEQQGKLGEEQGRLGEQQGKIAREADRKVHGIIKDALSSGKARPVE